jgi:hypothetical protein
VRKRISTEKAEWSDEREKQYKQDCLNIVFNFGDTLRNRKTP